MTPHLLQNNKRVFSPEEVEGYVSGVLSPWGTGYIVGGVTS